MSALGHRRCDSAGFQADAWFSICPSWLPHPLTPERSHRICTDLKIDPGEGWGQLPPFAPPWRRHWLYSSYIVCLSLCLYVGPSVCQSVSLSACIHCILSVCLSICLSLSICLCLSVFIVYCLSVYLSLCHVCLSVCLSICLCLSVSLSVCIHCILSVCPSITDI